MRTPAWALRPLPLVALLVAAGCASLLVDSYRYGTLEVLVTTPDGTGVPGVELTLYKSELHLAYASTDQTGWHRFELVPFGSLGVAARVPEGYSTTEGTDSGLYEDGIEMEEGGHREVRLTVLRCNGIINVRVVDDVGIAVDDVRVRVYKGPTTLAEMRTDSEGTARFTGLTCGDLGVSLEAPSGYALRPGRGGSYMDGLKSGQTEIEVEFTIDRIR